MTEYNEGDLVEAVKGDTVIRGRVNRHGELNLTMALTSDMLHLKANGYTVTLVQRATPPLPDVNGIYFPRRTFEPHIRVVTRAQGIWYDATGEPLDDDDFDWLNRRHASGDLTHFEPVPVTAKRVLDAVRKTLTLPKDGKRPNGEFIVTYDQIEAIAAEFGVTS